MSRVQSMAGRWSVAFTESFIILDEFPYDRGSRRREQCLSIAQFWTISYLTIIKKIKAFRSRKGSMLPYHFVFHFLGLLARTHLTQLVLEVLDFGLQLFLVTSDFVLLSADHHQRFKLALFAISSTSSFILRLVLEFLLTLLDLLLVCLQFGLWHFVVSDLVGVDETVGIGVIFGFLLLIWIWILLLLHYFFILFYLFSFGFCAWWSFLFHFFLLLFAFNLLLVSPIEYAFTLLLIHLFSIYFLLFVRYFLFSF